MIANMEAKRHSAAVLLQTAVRGKQARATQRQQHQAAIRIQHWQRGCAARRAVTAEARHKQFRQNSAAVRIQVRASPAMKSLPANPRIINRLSGAWLSFAGD